MPMPSLLARWQRVRTASLAQSFTNWFNLTQKQIQKIVYYSVMVFVEIQKCLIYLNLTSQKRNYLLRWDFHMYFSVIVNIYNGCVRLAFLGLPRGAHSGEPLTRTTTHRSRSDVVYLGPASKWPHSTSTALGPDQGEPLERRQSYSNEPGPTGDDPGKLNERTQWSNDRPVPKTKGVRCLYFSMKPLSISQPSIVRVAYLG